MAGIYVHIPFCKQACHYCDFHFSTNLSSRNEMTEAIVQELILQKDYLEGTPVSTIYFGGGTPSVLPVHDLGIILKTIRKYFVLSSDTEITLEANPDDLSPTVLKEMKEAKINRLSIGIQSFHDSALEFMNRAHDAHQAKQSVAFAREAGFDNISIDLIYNIPGIDHEGWRSSIMEGIKLNPEHISCYSLTVEEKTVFGKWSVQGKFKAPSDDNAAEQMQILVDTLTSAGYDHYEVSNFSKPGLYAKHNSNYWRGEKYLGVGPSAHSYNGISRQFNIRNNHIYLRALQNGNIPFEKEILTREDKINELLLTGLRTSWGCNLDELKSSLSYDLLADQREYIEQMIRSGKMEIRDNLLILTTSGRFLADQIASELFLIDTRES